MSEQNRDSVRYVFNVFTGKFDVVSDFNANRIITHEKNAAGNILQMYDPIASAYIEIDAQIVTDENGNVVTV